MAKPTKWIKLDNAAKIFPPTSNEKETWVFRAACQLTEAIVPEVLQRALNKTIKQFPFYTSVLRKGLFWYYFEATNLKPIVKEEVNPPCGVLYDPSGNNLLFKVTYYGKRINLEIYHALSDGTGALQFLRTLVFDYLTEKHKDSLDEKLMLTDYRASLEDKEQDSFSKYYTKEKLGALPQQKNAYQIKGECYPNNRTGVVEGVVSVKELLPVSKGYNATVTEYMTAVLLCAFHDAMTLRQTDKSIVIAIPVNLRNFFSSESAKNFFSVANISHNFNRQGSTFEEVLAHVQEQFRSEITMEKMRARLNSLYSAEENPLARIIPLNIKDMGLKAAEWLSGKQTTASFSNVGKIEMPTELSKYIDLFDFFTSTKHLQLCVCSYKDKMTISFTTRYISTNVQRYFFRELTRQGISVEIASNIVESGEITEEVVDK